MNKLKQFGASAVVALCSAPLFADDAAAVTNPLENVVEKATKYVDKGSDTVVTILTAGLVIVAAFYIWNLIKRGLHSAS